MNRNLEIGPVADEGEVRTFLAIARQALFFPDSDYDEWIDREGRENIRVARRGREIVAGLIVQRVGQFFGGRSVPMGAVRVVAVAPEHRGTGAGIALMLAALEELHRGGVPLSTLYPATQTLYRRAGFELAGVHTRYRAPAAAMDLRERSLRVRPAVPEDRATLQRLHREYARRTTGNLDRNEWAWQRILDLLPRRGASYSYIFERDGRAEGYVVFRQTPVDVVHRHKIDVADLVALTPAAAHRAMTFFGNHRSIVGTVSWPGPPVDPLRFLLPEPTAEIAQRIDWMLRLVDVAKALEARGYPQDLRAELSLTITDEQLPGNRRNIVLSVADGRGHVDEGGSGDLKIDAGALAPLYSGYLTALDLEALGRLAAPPEIIARATTLFAGPPPWMPDLF